MEFQQLLQRLLAGAPVIFVMCHARLVAGQLRSFVVKQQRCLDRVYSNIISAD